MRAMAELQQKEKAKMKHVWLQCEALVKRELDKLASGRHDDELYETPLSKELVTAAFFGEVRLKSTCKTYGG